MVVKKNSPIEWYNHIWIKVTGALITISAIFGIGYNMGNYQSEFDLKIQKMELQRECDEKLAKETNACRELKIETISNKVEDLQSLVKQLAAKKK